MPRIEFDAPFGDERKQVLLEQMEYGGNHWSVLVDGKKIAEIFERVGEYYYHDSELETADVQGIVDKITEFKKETIP